MHYFSNKFSKIAKRCGLSAPSASYVSILVTWSFVIWSNSGFWSWLWRNRFSKYSYDVILSQSFSVTSSPTHRKTSQKFFQFFPPTQHFWLRQWSWVNNLMFFKKSVLVLEKWSWSDRSWSWKNRWSCNLVVLLHHWLHAWIRLNTPITGLISICF